jgi:ferric-dicitrate binding protein FerR (iron transport regulator)
MSYADDRRIETTLVEGAVSVVSSNKEALLNPGVQAVFDKSNGDMALRNVDTRIYTAWKDGLFEFDNMPIGNICHVLSRWYDIEFKISDAEASIRFTGTIDRNKPLSFILDLIRDTKTIDYDMDDGKVIIK